MKKYKLISAGLIAAVMAVAPLTSCSDYLDVNENPNYPQVTTMEALLPSACASTVAQLGWNGCIIGNMWLQHTTQGNSTNQYNTTVNYSMSVSSYNTLFTNAYANTLPDLKEVIEKAEAAEAWNFWVVAKVLTAYNYHMLTDMYEDIPFTEAINHEQYPYPKYDDSKSVVYPGILAMLDEAIAKKNDALLGTNPTMGKYDMFMNGNMDNWIKFAKNLKLKVLMRDFATNGSAIESLLAEDDFLFEDCAMTCFEDATNKGNPLYEYNIRQLNTTQNIRACHTLCEYLITYKDPRIESIYEKVGRASSGETDYSVKYEGLPCGYKPATASVPLATTSRYYQAYDDPVYLMNAAEINFLVAEAYARLENAQQAKVYYEAGVAASFNRWSVSAGRADAFIAAGGPYAFDAASTDAMLKCILTQKWISYAKANTLDGVFDRNRTGIPSISAAETVRVSYMPQERELTPGYELGTFVAPATSVLESTAYPRRLLVPNVSSQYNPNAPQTKALDEPMWWQVAKGK